MKKTDVKKMIRESRFESPSKDMDERMEKLFASAERLIPDSSMTRYTRRPRWVMVFGYTTASLMIIIAGTFLSNKMLTEDQSSQVVYSEHTPEITSAQSDPNVPVYAQSGVVLKNIYAAGTRNGETLLMGKL